MGFKCGFIGLPNVGKSTIFNAITNLKVEASAYPFCTINPHFGTVPLNDRRLDNIHKIVGSSKKSPTILEFVDIAGLVKGAHKGEGLGNQFLSHIGMVDAIAHVVRCFEDENISHPYQSLDPVRDAEIVNAEIILKDIEIVDRHLQRFSKAAKGGDQKAKRAFLILKNFFETLSAEIELRSRDLSEDELALARELNLLTVKPVMYIANVDESHINESRLVESLTEYAESRGCPCIKFCGKVQAEIAELNQEDQLEFLHAMGLDETALQKLVKTGYDLLELITFFTANENEAHAWTVKKATPVVKAASLVHTDFEKGFIKAEVIKYKDIEEYGSIKKIHDLGLAMIHGRDYLVEDGDLIFFKVKK